MRECVCVCEYMCMLGSRGGENKMPAVQYVGGKGVQRAKVEKSKEKV